MDQKKIAELRDFVQLCKETPAVLHLPQLSFFKAISQCMLNNFTVHSHNNNNSKIIITLAGDATSSFHP